MRFAKERTRSGRDRSPEAAVVTSSSSFPPSPCLDDAEYEAVPPCAAEGIAARFETRVGTAAASPPMIAVSPNAIRRALNAARMSTPCATIKPTRLTTTIPVSNQADNLLLLLLLCDVEVRLLTTWGKKEEESSRLGTSLRARVQTCRDHGGETAMTVEEEAEGVSDVGETNLRERMRRRTMKRSQHAGRATTRGEHAM